MSLNIEKDVPYNKKGKTETIRSMKVGDSFIIDDYDQVRVMRTLFSRVGYKCSIQKHDSDTYRCWRVK